MKNPSYKEDIKENLKGNILTFHEVHLVHLHQRNGGKDSADLEKQLHDLYKKIIRYDSWYLIFVIDIEETKEVCQSIVVDKLKRMMSLSKFFGTPCHLITDKYLSSRYVAVYSREMDNHLRIMSGKDNCLLFNHHPNVNKCILKIVNNKISFEL
jgi:hypothetical protein